MNNNAIELWSLTWKIFSLFSIPVLRDMPDKGKFYRFVSHLLVSNFTLYSFNVMIDKCRTIDDNLPDNANVGKWKIKYAQSTAREEYE